VKAPRLLVAAVLAALLATAVAASIATAQTEAPGEVVARLSAVNKARAERDARHRLGLLRLPGGTRAIDEPPPRAGEELEEAGLTPGGGRFVTATEYWSSPYGPGRVLRYLRNHPPRGGRLGFESFGSGGPSIEFEWRHAPKGVWSASVILTMVKSEGGSVIRAEAWDWWELPRSPASLIPAGAHFLSVKVIPTGEGIPIPVEEGEPEPPPPVERFNSTERGAFIAGLTRLVNRKPAYQITSLPSCGPPAVGRTFDYELVFMAHRGGRVLATVSQHWPIGPCQPLFVRIPGAGSHALYFGWDVIDRVRQLIKAAKPRR
jgi:hypothetical protein